MRWRHGRLPGFPQAQALLLHLPAPCPWGRHVAPWLEACPPARCHKVKPAPGQVNGDGDTVCHTGRAGLRDVDGEGRVQGQVPSSPHRGATPSWLLPPPFLLSKAPAPGGTDSRFQLTEHRVAQSAGWHRAQGGVSAHQQPECQGRGSGREGTLALRAALGLTQASCAGGGQWGGGGHVCLSPTPWAGHWAAGAGGQD